MTVTDKDKVDVISTDRGSGDIRLTIADHLDWEDVGEHLLQLQDKLNAYLAFIESGEINDSYPNAIGAKLRIEVVAMHEVPDEAQPAIARFKELIEGAGFGFAHRVGI
jgi:hypothetical protein